MLGKSGELKLGELSKLGNPTGEEETEKESVKLPEWAKPDKCVITLVEALNVVMEQCEEKTIDFLCDLLGVDDEVRADIKKGGCKELLEKGCTECICGSSRATKGYVVCKVLQLLSKGNTLYDALNFAWAEIHNSCGIVGGEGQEGQEKQEGQDEQEERK